MNETKPIWEIEARSQASTVPKVTYGDVPPGWVQRRPEVGRPPALEPGVTYVVTGMLRRVGAGMFTYRGDE